MAAYIRYGLLLCMLTSALPKGYCNAIDSLKTKEEVQKFLVAKLSKTGIFHLVFCANISEPNKIKYYRSADTITIIDPESGKETIKILPLDSNSYEASSTESYPITPFKEVSSIIDTHPLYFYKADIDGNGYTDLVVDAGIVIIIMDMGDRFEAHMFSESADQNSYGFQKFISLPDGSTALLLRHDHNPCPLLKHEGVRIDTTYITDTTIVNTLSANSAKIDTSYAIITSFYSEKSYRRNEWRDTGWQYKDTLDIHLYNRLYNMTDTIVYKFHGFAKYNPDFSSLGITKIDYYSFASYGTTSDNYSCLQINKNGLCTLQYPATHIHTGFTDSLDNKSLSNLWHFISYIDIKSKKDSYRCETDHASGGTFIIYFDDGTIKRIRIWAYRPPMDLGYLSKIIFDATKTLHWQPTEKLTDFECPCNWWPLSNDLYFGCNCN